MVANWLNACIFRKVVIIFSALRSCQKNCCAMEYFLRYVFKNIVASCNCVLC